MIFNGKRIETIEELETEMTSKKLKKAKKEVLKKIFEKLHKTGE